MKRILCLSVGLGLALLTGCVTMSVYPFYTDKDLTYDPTLVGVWADASTTNASGETWTFERDEGAGYLLKVKEDDKVTEFDARLFKLKGQLFLDCLVRKREDYMLPCHILLRVDSLQSRLQMRLLDYEWLGELIEKQPKAIRHALVPGKKSDDQMLVLTADTAALQKFVLKHLATQEAWGDDPLVMKKQ